MVEGCGMAHTEETMPLMPEVEATASFLVISLKKQILLVFGLISAIML
jgi:hypothetical protein